MAERRITEKTGQRVICFISNYSWLDGRSFPGMRERYLDAFDVVRIDCLNGDRYETGKVAPDGTPDPSIFSTEGDPVGIQVGTAIATLVRKAKHEPSARVAFRHLWGPAKRAALTETTDAESATLYDDFQPVLPLGLPRNRCDRLQTTVRNHHAATADPRAQPRSPATHSCGEQPLAWTLERSVGIEVVVERARGDVVELAADVRNRASPVGHEVLGVA